MQLTALDADLLNATREAWRRLPGGVYFSEMIEGILRSQSFGSIRNRPSYQSTHNSVTEEGRVRAILQVIVSGDGRTKTVKLLDLILAPGADKESKETRLTIILTAILGIVRLLIWMPPCWQETLDVWHVGLAAVLYPASGVSI